MTRTYRTILAVNPTQARFMGITATANGEPESHDVQRVLQRGSAVVEIALDPES